MEYCCRVFNQWEPLLSQWFNCFSLSCRNNESLAEDNQPASGTNPLQSNLQAASVGQPPNSTSTAHLSSPEPDVVIVDVVPGTDQQHQRPPAASSSGSNRIRGRGGGKGNSRSGGPPSQPRGSRGSDTVAIRSTATGTSTRAASPGVYHSGSSLQSVGSGRYEGVECRITGEHSAVSDHEQYSDGVVAEDLDVDVGDMDFDDFDNFDEQEPEHKYGEQGAQLEEMDHSDYRDVPFVGSSGYNVGNEETMPTDTKVPATTASVEKEASWWRSSDTTLSKSSEIHQKTLSLKQRSFKPEFMNALVEDPANEVTATIKPPVASVKPMPVTNSRQLSSRKSLVISSEFEGVETFHDSPSEAPFHARGSPFVPGKEKPALLKLSDVCSGSVWNNSPVVRVKVSQSLYSCNIHFNFVAAMMKLLHSVHEWCEVCIEQLIGKPAIPHVDFTLILSFLFLIKIYSHVYLFAAFTCTGCISLVPRPHPPKNTIFRWEWPGYEAKVVWIPEYKNVKLVSLPSP